MTVSYVMVAGIWKGWRERFNASGGDIYGKRKGGIDFLTGAWPPHQDKGAIMKASDRITGLTGGGDDGWGLMLRARAMLDAGEDIIELTIGEHDIRTDPSILAAMHEAAMSGHTGYADMPGIPALRQAVASRVQAATGVPTGPENVVITPGGQAGLFASHIAVCQPGDRALFIDPYYATYPGTIRGASAVPVAIEARAEDGFQPCAKAISAVAKGAASLLINSPNNPTGILYSRKTLEGIAYVVKAHDMWLISDEVYDTQIWEGAHISPRTLPGMAERTLVIGSMSKSHAMTGSRCGWIIGPEHIITDLTNLATNTTYGVPGYIQDAALFALDQGKGLEEKVAAPFRRRRAAAKAAISAQNVVQLVPAQGAMYLMLNVHATGLSGEAFAEALLEHEKIAVMPGRSFGAAAHNHIRVAMTVKDDLFNTAIARLLDFAAKHASNQAKKE